MFTYPVIEEDTTVKRNPLDQNSPVFLLKSVLLSKVAYPDYVPEGIALFWLRASRLKDALTIVLQQKTFYPARMALLQDLKKILRIDFG